MLLELFYKIIATWVSAPSNTGWQQYYKIRLEICGDSDFYYFDSPSFSFVAQEFLGNYWKNGGPSLNLSTLSEDKLKRNIEENNVILTLIPSPPYASSLKNKILWPISGKSSEGA